MLLAPKQPENLAKFFSLPSEIKYNKNCEPDKNNIALVLKNKELWFANPANFNDPFDSSFHINLSVSEEMRIEAKFKTEANVKIREYLNGLGHYPTKESIDEHIELHLTDELLPQKYMRSVIDNTVVCSFTSFTNSERENFLSEKSINMWSHYAQDHRGFMIEFDNFEPNSSPALELFSPVIYTDKYPVFGFSEVELYGKMLSQSDRSDAVFELQTKLYLWKKRSWRDENEYRNIQDFSNPTDGLENKGKTFSFNETQIKSIYLGCKISDAHVFEIKEVLRTYNVKPNLFRMSKREGNYSLKYEQEAY